MSIITLVPHAAGWTMTTDTVANDLLFRSGAEAEKAAINLAERLFQAGLPCEVRIHLRNGASLRGLWARRTPRPHTKARTASRRFDLWVSAGSTPSATTGLAPV